MRQSPSTLRSTPVALVTGLLIAAPTLLPATDARATSSFELLHAFNDMTEGDQPYAGVTRDASGALYGTTAAGPVLGPGKGSDQGTVYRLAPPAAGKTVWPETILKRFTGKSDGGMPHADLVLDPAGRLYGVTTSGGSPACLCGMVFSLAPPARNATAWTESALLRLTAPQGEAPTSALLRSKSGALFGTAPVAGGADGVAFELAPPAAGKTIWHASTLHAFTDSGRVPYDGGGPSAGLVADPAGALYGTTTTGGKYNFYGVVYRLTPPAAGKTAWTETVLHDFSGKGDGGVPKAALIVDKAGALYGTTYAGGTCTAFGTTTCGVVFKLTPPAGGKGSWTETVLHVFDGTDGRGPQAALLLDKSGALYGTTTYGGITNDNGFDGYGVVFKLAPVAGKTAWKETVLYSFTGANDGAYPMARLVEDGAGALYGTALGAGAYDGGTVFKVIP